METNSRRFFRGTVITWDGRTSLSDSSRAIPDVLFSKSPTCKKGTPRLWTGKCLFDGQVSPECVSFFKQSQVMMSTELPVSIKISCTITLAIFNLTTKGSSCGEANRGASFPANTIVGTVTWLPCLAVRIYWAPRSG